MFKSPNYIYKNVDVLETSFCNFGIAYIKVAVRKGEVVISAY
jgi:hypothetical protein